MCKFQSYRRFAPGAGFAIASLVRCLGRRALALSLAVLSLSVAAPAQQLRPPAVPLLTSDPYFSVWSEADRATDDVTRHWTRHPQSLSSVIRVDGASYLLLGDQTANLPVLTQRNLEVTPTRTVYTFENAKVSVSMTFLTPALPTDLDIYSRPITYLTWSVQSLDGKPHQVQIYEGTSSLLSVNDPLQKVSCSPTAIGDLIALKSGSIDQTYLRPAGDDTRIDWGYLYAVAPRSQAQFGTSFDAELKLRFAKNGGLGDSIDSKPWTVAMPPMTDGREDTSRFPPTYQGTTLGFSFDLGSVGAQEISRTMMLGYDEIYSIDYYGTKLRPYWRRNGDGPEQLFQKAYRDYPALDKECRAFDQELMDDARKVGGDKYAQIIALAYRECVAANGLAADANGQPLFFTKEDTSNGDIATVDVIFPMDPIWILLSPTLAKASLVSNFMYAASPHWKFPNAPHDLGTYPQVTGRDDGGEGMPVEESGNMILLTDAIAHDENSPEFANLYWPQLTQWAQYLEKYGLDPEDQLCTDDFMGHLAHNANLSVKAILALAAYGDLCRMRGDKADAEKYKTLATQDAKHWMEVADAGDHSLLAFDKPGTWSQKYNMVWDQILGLGVFPKFVREKEVAYYKQKMLKYGVPLDSRTKLTKTDWSIWSATLATNKEDFESIVSPIFDYLNETTVRDPIADSYVTDDKNSEGMHARPVVGGFFIKMLDDPGIWHKWVSRDHQKLGTYAPLPKPLKYDEIVPTGRDGAAVWKYTVEKPATGWETVAFDDSNWSTGQAGFGTQGTPAVAVKTVWSTDDIWLRRQIKLPKTDYQNAVLTLFHDEDVEVYFNGVLAASEPGYITNYEHLDISPEAKKLLIPGATITVAVHCHQTTGGQGIDVGIGKIAGD